MNNRWYCSASLMLLLVVPHLVHGGFFTVQNCTPTFLFVAQMRTKARTDDKKAYFDSKWNKSELLVKALPPLASIAMTSDTQSGYATYNRVLWVSNNLKELEKAIRKEDRTGTQVDSLYIGGKQSGVKYIALVGGNKFMLAPTKEEALKKILPIKESELETAAKAVLGSLTNAEYNKLYMSIDTALAAQEQARFYDLNRKILKNLKNEGQAKSPSAQPQSEIIKYATTLQHKRTEYIINDVVLKLQQVGKDSSFSNIVQTLEELIGLFTQESERLGSMPVLTDAITQIQKAHKEFSLQTFNNFLKKHRQKPAENAQVSSIKKAFRQASLVLHPDKSPDNPESTAIFQEMSNIYEKALQYR